MVTEKQLFCGVFDSKQCMKNIVETNERTVFDYEIELFETDGGISFIDGHSYPVKRGMLLFVKPNQKRHSRFPVRCRYIRINPLACIPKELSELLDGFPDCIYLESKQEFDRLFCQFEQLGQIWLRETPSPDALMLNALFYNLLHQCRQFIISAELSKTSAIHSKLAMDVRSYLNAHFFESCSLHVLSRKVHASPNHIRTVFQKEFGISPYEYVLQKRIEEAKFLIAGQNISFTDIAIRLGFCSQSHFNKIFKDRVHCTPKEYQEEAVKLYFNSL